MLELPAGQISRCQMEVGDQLEFDLLRCALTQTPQEPGPKALVRLGSVRSSGPRKNSAPVRVSDTSGAKAKCSQSLWPDASAG